jgi:hypothetical protein
MKEAVFFTKQILTDRDYTLSFLYAKSSCFYLRNQKSRIEKLPLTYLPLGITGDNSFGEDNMSWILFCDTRQTADQMIESVYPDLLGFTAGTWQQDDLTAALVKVDLMAPIL